MIVAVIALIAGLGGGAIGATLITGAQIKDGSVTGADIRDKSLAGKDLKDSSVTGALVRNGSLQANDLSSAARASLRAGGVAGSPGVAGPQGPPGPQGQPGTATAYGQVLLGMTPAWDRMSGFPEAPDRVGNGVYCITAPAGVDPAETPVALTVAGGGNGFVTHAVGPGVGATCDPNAFEIWTDDTSASPSNSVPFNIIVP